MDAFNSSANLNENDQPYDATYEEVVSTENKKKQMSIPFSDKNSHEFYNESSPDIPFDQFMKKLGCIRTPEGNWVK